VAGASAERLRLKPIFISSPTLVLQAAYRMFFVTGEMWRDLAWSAVGYSSDSLAPSLSASLWALPPAGIGVSYAVEPFLAALNATPRWRSSFDRDLGRHRHGRAGSSSFCSRCFRSLSMPMPPCAPPTRV
jgi:hypothetical protein